MACPITSGGHMHKNINTNTNEGKLNAVSNI